MNKLSNKARMYARLYKQPPYGREIEGTAELLLQMAEKLQEYESLGGTGMNMSKEKAMKPVKRIETYLKYGFVIVEHQYMNCPRCSATLNAGPCYQPKYCDQCGQKLDFSEIEWKEDKELGFAREAAYESIQN